MAVPFSVSLYDDGTNRLWHLISEFAVLPIPGDGSEAQLARMTQGDPAGLGPNGWQVLTAMQKLQRQYSAAVGSGNPADMTAFTAELKKTQDALAALKFDTASTIAVAVNDEEDRREKARLAVK